MSFNWTEFLTLAEALQSDPDSPGPPEAALRSAASRAYYAAFHCALDFATREGFTPTYTGEDHSRIQDHFRRRKPPGEARRKIAQELNRAYDHRRKADYRDTLGTTSAETLAHFAIGSARNVLANLDSIATD